MARIRFTAEPGEDVPGWLLKPKGAKAPLPVMICLQGHSPGMHISIGEARNEAERRSIAGGRDLALQAVAQGWAALQGFRVSQRHNKAPWKITLDLSTMLGEYSGLENTPLSPPNSNTSRAP